MNIFNTSLEETVKRALFYKDNQGILRKKTKDYSGLKAALANELNFNSGIGRSIQPKN